MRNIQHAVELVSEFNRIHKEHRPDKEEFSGNYTIRSSKYHDFLTYLSKKVYLSSVSNHAYGQSDWEVMYLCTHLIFFGRLPEMKTTEIPNPLGNFIGSKVHLNERYIGNVITNLTEVTFEQYFPRLIISCAIGKEKYVSHENIFDVMDFMLRANKDLKEDGREEERKLIKKWINRVYGMLMSDKKGGITANFPLAQMVSARGSMHLARIIGEFSNHVVYVDTDAVIFRHFNEISDRFDKMAKFPYIVESNKCGMFFAKKKYWTADMPNIDFVNKSGSIPTNNFVTLANFKMKGIKAL